MERLAFRIGNFVFQPQLGWGIAAATFVVLTVALGNWQIRRADEKIDTARRVDEAMLSAVLPVPPRLVEAGEFEHRRTSVFGRFVPASMFFIDNRVLHGAAGYHVITPMKIEGGDIHVLVNRGWVEAGDRGVLPVVPTGESLQRIEGIAVTPGKAFELGPDSESSPVRQNLVIEREQRRLGVGLQPFVIQQTSDAQDGLQRSWARRDAGADRNKAYALQWYALAILGALLYVVLSTRRAGPNGR